MGESASRDSGDCYISKVFGENVFSYSVIKERLPEEIYCSLKKSIDEKTILEPSTAEVIANAMKDWAMEKYATHYTHWFQPMTGATAEKHDSFISSSSDGTTITKFSGKDLIKGEPDASSFPSGGLRTTSEARGYTVWDYTSPAFVKGNTLYIPTVFCSYTGQALDKKIPLLRSEKALSEQMMRVSKLFEKDDPQGNIPKSVTTTVGIEQEYFLIDKKVCVKRKDLLLTGRTLFGAKPPKGQELEDHYFGSIRKRVLEFMCELDTELWKLGIQAKTRHNEVAPAQHELAPMFTSANVASDNNQLVMETLRKVADKHGFVCLLHEKPFDGVNGSGKHNNWSLCADGRNLLEPGQNPHQNVQFITLLCAIIKAVDEYSDLIRFAASSPGNDLRLGANEAPPTIISIYLGKYLTNMLEQIESGQATISEEASELSIGISTLPAFQRDYTDRNRTSPFAFTGNKFEFRMVPSSISASGPNYILNTIVAESLSYIADKLEDSKNFKVDLQNTLKDIINKHKRIIFNGDNYSKEWIQEAQKRGLSNISCCVESIACLIDPKNRKILSKHGVLSESEIEARYEVLLSKYIKTVKIEALTMLELTRREIIPAVIEYTSQLAKSINIVKSADSGADVSAQKEQLATISKILGSLNKKVHILEKPISSIPNCEESTYRLACYFKDEILTKMSELREDVDLLETMVGSKYWPFPTYVDLLFYV